MMVTTADGYGPIHSVMDGMHTIPTYIPPVRPCNGVRSDGDSDASGHHHPYPSALGSWPDSGVLAGPETGVCNIPKKAISRNRGYLGPPRIPLITGSGALMMVAREYVVVVTTTYPFRLGYTTMVSM